MNDHGADVRRALQQVELWALEGSQRLTNDLAAFAQYADVDSTVSLDDDATISSKLDRAVRRYVVERMAQNPQVDEVLRRNHVSPDLLMKATSPSRWVADADTRGGREPSGAIRLAAALLANRAGAYLGLQSNGQPMTTNDEDSVIVRGGDRFIRRHGFFVPTVSVSPFPTVVFSSDREIAHVTYEVREAVAKWGSGWVCDFDAKP
jgi:hypothetical protein